MFDLQEKIAIVSGASSGIGYATAKLLGTLGARVVVTARREEPLRQLVKEINDGGGCAKLYVGDVTEEVHAKKLMDFVDAVFGGLDIAINNAGIIGAQLPVTELSADVWQRTLTTNLTSMFFAAKHQVPAMVKRGGGSLVFISSFVGYTAGFANMVDYAASKAGLIGMAKALAVELGDKNIRVNALLPGGTDTPMNIANAPEVGPEVRDYVNGIHALKRLATPEEIARSIVYLASDAASFVTGSAMLVDGGVSVQR